MQPPSGDDHNEQINELRQRLRSLGYLDAGVGRFVVGRGVGSRRVEVIAALASIRIGLLAGLLLGPTAAVGLAARLPELVTGPRDALVVALYMGVFFAGAAAITIFLLGLIVTSLAKAGGRPIARRARMISLVTGALATVVCVVYLTLWCRAAGVTWSPGWVVCAIVMAGTISLLLGYAVSVTAFLLIVSAAPPSQAAPARPPVPVMSWKLTAGTAALALVLAALTIKAVFPFENDSPPPRLPIAPTGLRVRLFAIDGFDPTVFQELAAAGRVPALTSILNAAHARLAMTAAGGAAEDVRDPARAWTTIATGHPPAAHGVYALETRRVAGLDGSVTTDQRSSVSRAVRGATDLLRLTRPAIVGGGERREKMFWEVAADAGLRTAVVNWWATWPATSRNGTVLSDRATLRLEHGGALDAEIAPSELYDQLRAEWSGIRDKARSAAADALGQLAVEPEIEALLQRSAELDAIQLELTQRVSSKQTDLTIAYLPGLDIAQYALLNRGEDTGALPPSVLTARLAVLKHYYVALDRLMTPLLTASREGALAHDDVVMFVTEPGRVSGDPVGVLAARGGSARRDAAVAGGMLDIAPTVLYALGVPISRQLRGRPLVELFDDRFSARNPIRFVDTYGRFTSRPTAREGQPLDREMIDRLRSLGYVR